MSIIGGRLGARQRKGHSHKIIEQRADGTTVEHFFFTIQHARNWLRTHQSQLVQSFIDLQTGQELPL